MMPLPDTNTQTIITTLNVGVHVIYVNYTVSRKKGATVTMAITLTIHDRFAKFFHCCKEH